MAASSRDRTWGLAMWFGTDLTEAGRIIWQESSVGSMASYAVPWRISAVLCMQHVHHTMYS